MFGRTVEIEGLQWLAREMYPWTSPIRVPLNEYQNALALQGRLTPAVSEAFQKADQVRESTRAVIYIAGALTGVDEKTKERYVRVGQLLSGYDNIFFGYAPHLHGTDPVKHPDITPREVRDIDNLWADAVADLHVNFLDPLAHGNAIEEGWAEKRMIPSVYITPKDIQLSRLTRGMENVSKTVTYGDFESDGVEQLKIFFDEFAAWLEHYKGRDPREFFYFSLQAINALGLSMLSRFDLKEDGTYPLDDDIVVYVKNPSHSDYGKVGSLRSHFVDSYSWYEIEFDDHRVQAYGDLSSFSLWINPSLLIESPLKVKGVKKLLSSTAL